MEWIDFSPWGRPLIAAVIAVVVALVVHRIGRSIVLRVSRFSTVLHTVLERIDRPMLFLLPLAAVQVVWQGSPDDLPGLGGVQHATSVLIIAAIASVAMRAMNGLADGMMARHPVNVTDNLEARRIQTQTRVLARITNIIIVVAAAALMLMTFPGARQFGASLLASAGVLSLVAGLAARSVFSNLLAGLQIALAQPIRIDDVLIVQGEWGRVEEITSTYVVLLIWDQRRLIIPLQWFIENPFQNWTRTGSEILGTVFLWVDYGTPLEGLRREAERLCRESPDWDGRLCKVQVTDTNERAMQLRVLASAQSSGQAWELRCLLREGLIAYLRREQPEALPRLRGELQS